MKKKIIVTIGILATFSFMIASRPFASQAGIKDNQKVYSQTEHTQDGFVVDKESGDIIGYEGNAKEITLPKNAKNVCITENPYVEKVIIPIGANFTNNVDYHIEERNVSNYNVFHGCLNLKEIVFEYAGNSRYLYENGMLLSKDKTHLYSVLPGYAGIVTIPASVQSIDEGAFVQALKVTGYKVEAGNSILTEKDGVLYSKDGKELKVYPLGNTARNFTVPEGVKKIGCGAFSYSPYLQKIVMAKTVNEQGLFAFEECKELKNVVNNKGLRYIYSCAYRNCSNLTVKIPDGVEILEESALNGVKKVTIPASAIVRNYDFDLGVWTIGKNKTKLPALKVKKVKTKSSVVKGTGKPNTKWYNKKKSKFYLSSPDDLAGLSKLVASGVSFFGKDIILTKNLDMRKYKNWTPIGKFNYLKEEKKGTFRGNFDGRNKTIYNLTLNRQTQNGAGLFGIIGEDGTVENIKVKTSCILGYANVGGIAGVCYGEIINCSFSGKISGRQYVGGIVGNTCTDSGASIEPGKIKKCKNAASIRGTSYVGGIAGRSTYLYKNVNKGSVKGYFDLDGISGAYLKGTKKKCKSTGKVSVIR